MGRQPGARALPSAPDADLRRRLSEDFDIDADFLEDFIGVAPRDWLHYPLGRLLPDAHARRLPLARRRRSAHADERHAAYLRGLTELVSRLTDRGTHVPLTPMHLAENDTDLCHALRAQAARSESVRVLDKDTLSPPEFRSRR